MSVCQLCGLEVTETTQHHWIPRTRHANKRNKRDFSREQVRRTADFCRPCHDKVHSLLTEKQLGRTYNSLEKLLEQPEIRKWLRWRRKHPRVRNTPSKRSRQYG